MKKQIEIISRIGIFGTFLGHGLIAITHNTKWIPLLTCYGFSKQEALHLFPFIGTLDIIVAFTILISPLRIVVIWATLWAFMTALSRPISGDSFIEFVERAANWCLPLVLFLMLGIPKNISGFIKVKD